MKSMLSKLRRALFGASLGVAALAGVAQAESDAAPSKTTEPYVYVRFQTAKGDVVLELNQAKAPITVQNFLKYVDDGFYNDTVIHRVVNGSIGVIQGGGFDANLKEKTTRDPIKNEWGNGLTNDRGTISMARTPVADSATSQWFINTRNNQPLDRALPPSGNAGYAVFGKIIDGMTVIDEIAAIPPVEKTLTIQGRPLVAKDVPSELVTITKAERLKTEDVSNLIAAARAAEAEADKAKAAAAAAENAKKREVGAQSLALAADFLKKHDVDSTKGTFTDSGLWSIVTTPGTGDAATPQDTVTVHYTGWLPDGTKFDSSVDRGSPATFPLRGVIPGWTEGVGSMKVGEKRFFVIRPELAYGKRGSPPVIPADATLIFEVELLSIQPRQ